MFLTVDHEGECEILEQSVFLDPHQDGVLPGIFFCHIPDNQRIPNYEVPGALLCGHHSVLQPVETTTYS